MNMFRLIIGRDIDPQASAALIHKMSTSAPDWMDPLFNVCLTENGDLTHLTSLDACLDFFYKVFDTTAHDRVQD